jgi:hypothetical protein
MVISNSFPKSKISFLGQPPENKFLTRRKLSVTTLQQSPIASISSLFTMSAQRTLRSAATSSRTNYNVQVLSKNNGTRTSIPSNSNSPVERLTKRPNNSKQSTFQQKIQKKNNTPDSNNNAMEIEQQTPQLTQDSSEETTTPLNPEINSVQNNPLSIHNQQFTHENDTVSEP